MAYTCQNKDLWWWPKRNRSIAVAQTHIIVVSFTARQLARRFFWRGWLG